MADEGDGAVNKREKQALAADGALLCCAVMWGGGFVAAKVALESVTPYYVLALRVLGAGLLLCVLFWRKLRTVNRKALGAAAVLSLFLLVGQALQTIGLQYTQPGKQAFLVASYSLLIPFVSWLVLKCRPQWPSFLAGVVMLTGIGFLSLSGGGGIQLGDGLSLLSAVVFAFNMVLISFFVRRYDPLQLSILQLMFAGGLALILALFLEPPLEAVTARSAWAVAYLLVINTAVAFSVQNVAQKFTSATHSSILLSLESLFGMIFSILLLNEVFTPRMLFGVVLIFAAVFISHLEKAAA